MQGTPIRPLSASQDDVIAVIGRQLVSEIAGSDPTHVTCSSALNTVDVLGLFRHRCLD